MSATSSIYVPAPLTSVEQAEALPVGTIAYRTRDDEAGRLVATLCYDDEELAYFWKIAGEQFGYDTAHMLSWGGWTVLTFTKVEVEHLRETSGAHRSKTLYVAPWEVPS